MALLMMFVLIVASIAEVFGMLAIIPLTELFLEPVQAHENRFVKFILYYMPETETTELVQILIPMLSAILVMSFMLKAFSAYLVIKTALMREGFFSALFVDKFLWKEYSWYFLQNRSNLKKIAISEVNAVVNSGLLSYLVLLTQSFVCTIILLVLMVQNFKVTLLTITMLATCYALIYFLLRKPLLFYGKRRFTTNETRFKVIDDALSNPKTVQVNRLESRLYQSFKEAAYQYAHSQVIVQTIKMLPRYVLEIFALLTVLIFLIIHSQTSTDSIGLTASVSLFVLAGYRILPAAQQIYAAKAQLDASLPSIRQITDYLEDGVGNRARSSTTAIPHLRSNVRFDDITHCYQETGAPCLESINFTIKKGEMVGIRGNSGSGKTTLLNILMGLIQPTSGGILVDGVCLTDAMRLSWQSNLGYVTQEVVMFDRNLVENITLLEDGESLDIDKLNFAWHVARIDQFSSLTGGNGHKKIGDQGETLSGGQKQRVALARALYRKPDILILDEATSALDSKIQLEIFEGLVALKGEMTIVFTSHNEAMFQFCDRIYDLKPISIK